jgi:hypothetical protein
LINPLWLEEHIYFSNQTPTLIFYIIRKRKNIIMK